MKAIGSSRQAASVLLLCALASCGTRQQANQDNFTTALNDFLAAHGDMCVDKVNWPIDVTLAEAQAHTPNALQMPALQKAGLVSGTQISGTQIDGQAQPVMRFQLTDEGRKFYLHKKMTSMSTRGTVSVHDGDLCYGKLSVDQVIAWEPPREVAGHRQTVVTYTYRLDAAPWARDAGVQEVFPVVAMLVKRVGSLQLKQTVELTDQGWIGKAGVG